MPEYDRDLLDAARLLIARATNQRGKLPAARIRRSISTTCYAIFHFLLNEAGRLLIGSTNDLHRRRRTLARTFSHSGTKIALDKVRGARVDDSVADLLRPAGIASGDVVAPAFARELAVVFSDAQAKRHDADYDRNSRLSELDATVLIDRVEKCVRVWRSANSASDRDFKHALCVLMLLKGQLRRDH
jgi:hypothetical protein